ncbi:MAG: hypothetical protein LBS33_06060 [Streptococcaceae bacterium]|jgi:hypothetical protein|nr:hypothetical protein [Streptococcaceae bacterium]
MKKWKVNKRKLASIGVLGAIATLGIFAGTYAKYVSVLPLTSGEDTDLSARVAFWDVGLVNNKELVLFSPNYYGASGDSRGEHADSGHDGANTIYDTVFVDGRDNLVAPGTHGYKTIRIHNGDPAGKGDPVTEVTYKLTVGDTVPSATITDDAHFKNQLKFTVLTDIEVSKGNITVDWQNGRYTKIGDTSSATVIPWKSVTDALAGMYTDGDNATNLGNVKEIKNIVVLWKWDFEAVAVDNDVKDTELATRVAGSIPNISINFGTIRAEQVD